jgi:hypothetical protein
MDYDLQVKLAVYGPFAVTGRLTGGCRDGSAKDVPHEPLGNPR